MVDLSPLCLKSVVRRSWSAATGRAQAQEARALLAGALRVPRRVRRWLSAAEVGSL